MNRMHDYSSTLEPLIGNVHERWDVGVGRAGKALICVSLFSIIVFVSGACVFAALLRAFPPG